MRFGKIKPCFRVPQKANKCIEATDENQMHFFILVEI